MAKSDAFQVGSNTSVIIGTEVTPGTPTSASSGVTLEMPVTEYSFSDINKHSLSVAPFRSGLGGMTQSDDMVKWQEHDRMHEISLTFQCSDLAINRICLALFGDGTTPNALLGSMPTTVQSHVKHGVANITPVTLWFENAAHTGLATDLYFTSCMCTSFTISGDVGANAGVVSGTATFVTGYKATEAALEIQSTSATNTLLTAHTTLFNMHDMVSQSLNGQDLVLYSFDLTIARDVQRIGFDKDADMHPMGYSVGGYEVTGNLTAKRDDHTLSAIGRNSGMELNLDTTVFQILAPKLFVDDSAISFDADGWKQNIPFRCTYDSAATSNAVVTISTAA